MSLSSNSAGNLHQSLDELWAPNANAEDVSYSWSEISDFFFNFSLLLYGPEFDRQGIRLSIFGVGDLFMRNFHSLYAMQTELRLLS